MQHGLHAYKSTMDALRPNLGIAEMLNLHLSYDEAFLINKIIMAVDYAVANAVKLLYLFVKCS